MEDFLERPLVFFDLETTGTSVARDRVAEIALVKPRGEGLPPDELHLYIYPGIPMPEEATKIHGLTDDFLKQYKTFKEHAREIYEFVKGCDLAGHNIMGLDVPLLVEEFLRVGIEFPEPGTKFVDTFMIQAKLVPRTLEFVHYYWTGSRLEKSELHGALSDTKAAMKVYKHQVEHSDMKDETRESLHTLATRDRVLVDFAGKLKLNDKNQIVYSFGKNDNKTVTSDPQYANWILGNDFTEDTKRWIRHALKYENQYFISDKKKEQLDAKAEQAARASEATTGSLFQPPDISMI